MMKALVQAFAVGANRAGDATPELQLGEQRFRLPDQAPADALLARAAAAALARLALPRPLRPRLEFAPSVSGELAGEAPEMGARSAQLLWRWMEGEDLPLLQEALALVAARGRRVPLALLPRLMTALDSPQRRDWLRPVVGAGTNWLARMNRDWRWALGESSDALPDFETASGAARVGALQRLRERDAGHARELLAARFGENDAEARTVLLEALETGLSADDEAFLERTLDDRAKGVRLVAANLLSRLPGSALSQRALGRVQGLLELERGLLRKTLKVNLPEAPDKAEERDGIDGKSAIPGLYNAGPRQLQLAQRLSQVPVAALAAQLSMPVAELVERAAGNEFSQPLLAGLCLSASRQPEGETLRALATLASEPKTNFLYQQWILPLLPTLPDYEAFVLARLRAEGPDRDLLERLPGPWPDAIGDAVLAWARHPQRRADLARDYSDGGYVALLRLAAMKLHPREQSLRDWPELGGEEATSAQRRAAAAIDDLLRILRSRLEFSNSLEST
jgi:hypothetical protein